MDNLSPNLQPHLRQSYTAAQKIRIVQESMRPDASIAAVVDLVKLVDRACL